ncbi:MAG: amino acid adenylation domain-containing protein [Bacteroidota bacterium]
MNTTNELTNSQRLIWLGQQLLPNSPMNNMAFAFHWHKAIEVEAFQEAFKRLVAASDSMRIQLVADAGEVRQRVRTASDFSLPFLDFTHQPDPRSAMETWLSTACRTSFDLNQQLYDAALIKVADTHYVFYLNQHHLITDGWGKSIQLRWLMQTYDHLLDPGKLAPPPLTSFADYANELATLESQSTTLELQKQWRKRVEDQATSPRLFGRENPRLASASTRFVRQLSRQETQALLALAQEPDIRNWSKDLALFTVFATVLIAFVHRISGATKISIGAPAHNRLTPAHKQTPGVFIELFPLLVNVSPTETYGSLLQQVKEESMYFLRYGKPATSSPDTGKHFNVMLNYINVSFLETADENFAVDWLHPGETEPGHHLKLQVHDFAASGEMNLIFDLNDEVVPRDVQSTIHDQFAGLLSDFVHSRDGLIATPSSQLEAQLAAFQTVDTTYPQSVNLVDLFYASVAEHADRVAIRFRGQGMTYSVLEQRTNQLANYLLALDFPEEALVAVCMDRSLEMSITLWGILKAGGAYVPIDPEYPQERVDYILADAQADYVITTRACAHLFPPDPTKHVLVIDEAQEKLATYSDQRPGITIRPEQLMYMLYTSGSTGQPKGVMNQHDGLVNRLWWAQQTFQLQTGKDAVLQKTTFCFDVSVWELFLPHLVGATLVFAEPEGHKDPAYLRRVMAAEKVTTLHFVPPMLELFLTEKAELPDLRQVICSGEALQPHQVNRFRSLYPLVDLHNLYGPTEAAIDVTHWPAPQGSEPVKHVPIGKPIANVPIRIMNEAGQDCPIGVPGELLIGGVQVARGYHNKPDLTAEKFVALTDVDQGPQRFYRTGDLVRWLPDGNIDFLGRIDFQVKLRGFRIELGEIEHQLTRLPMVTRASVLVKDISPDNPQLVAYVVSEGAFDAGGAKAALAAFLPPYMVPGHFVEMESFPLTVNGKLDRKKFPVPTLDGATSTDQAPTTEVEILLHDIWVGVLGITKMGVDDSFLDLGGHSLTAIRLINRMNEALHLSLPAGLVFRFPTLRTMGREIERIIEQLLAEMNEEG